MPQVGERPGLVVIGPEKRAQRIPSLTFPVHRKIRQKRRCLAATCGDGLVVQKKLRGTQKVQSKLWGHLSPFASTVFDYIPESWSNLGSYAFRHAPRHG